MDVRGTLSRRLDMRAMKIGFALIAVLVLVRYIPVYYHSSEFNEYVKEETRHTRQRNQLKDVLISKAGEYAVQVTEDNINITTSDSVLHVAVDYRVPVDFILFRHEVQFHAAASRTAFD
jgi:hypothetical protein